MLTAVQTLGTRAAAQELVRHDTERYILDRVGLAIDLKTHDITTTGKAQPFLKYLKEVWGDNDRIKKFFLPEGLTPWEPKDTPIIFQAPPYYHGSALAEADHYQGRFAGITFRTKPFDEADSIETLQKARNRFEEFVAHETEHIFFQGANLDIEPETPRDERIRATVAYLLHPGELRAHARQYSVRFLREYPQTPFSVEKLLVIQPDTTLHNYFERFRADDLNKEFPELNLRAGSLQLEEMISGLVNERLR